MIDADRLYTRSECAKILGYKAGYFQQFIYNKLPTVRSDTDKRVRLLKGIHLIKIYEERFNITDQTTTIY